LDAACRRRRLSLRGGTCFALRRRRRRRGLASARGVLRLGDGDGRSAGLGEGGDGSNNTARLVALGEAREPHAGISLIGVVGLEIGVPDGELPLRPPQHLHLVLSLAIALALGAV